MVFVTDKQLQVEYIPDDLTCLEVLLMMFSVTARGQSTHAEGELNLDAEITSKQMLKVGCVRHRDETIN